MNTSQLTPLIDLLAHQDAVFTPIRDWSNRSAVAAVYEAREQFLRRGLPYKAGGTGAEREAGRAAADKLERGKLVRFFREAGKRVGWKLSDTGDWCVRDFVLQYGYREMLVALQTIALHVESGHSCGPCVREDALAGDYELPEQSLRLGAVEDMLLPALARGLADSHADTAGHVWYALTDHGTKFLAKPSAPSLRLPVFKTDAAWIKARGPYLKAADSYRDGVADHIHRLNTTAPGRQNHVVVPLSQGIGPESPARFGPIVAIDAEGLCGLVAPKPLNGEPTAKAAPRRGDRHRGR